MELKYREFLIWLISLAVLHQSFTEGCGDVPVVENAEPTESNVEPPFANGVGIPYKCKEDFKATSGSHIALCDRGTWQRPTFQCESVGCKVLPFIKHTSPEDKGDLPFSIGTSITYECDPGFRKQGGTTVAVCSFRNGKAQFEAPSLKCVPVDCGPPPDAPHSKKLGNLFIFPNDVSYVCDVGYTMIGNKPNTTCQSDGTWSNRPPTCEIVKCPAPDRPINGNFEAGDRIFRSVIKYTCNEGFRLKGAKEVECLSNGQWSEETPSCEDVSCPAHSNLPGGHIVYGAHLTKVGSLMIVQCDAPDGTQSTLKCNNDGEWSPAFPICQGAILPTRAPTTTSVPTTTDGKHPNRNGSLCGDPGLIAHGRIDQDDIKFPTSSSVKFVCDDGYTIKGKTILNCLASGLWDSTELPKCEKRTWLEIVIGVVVGIIVVVVICGAAIFFYMKKRKSRRPNDSPLNPGNRNKAKVFDAKTREEMRYLERDHKVIPVTSL